MTLDDLILRGGEVTSLKLSLWGNIPIWGWIMIMLATVVLFFIVRDFIYWGEYFAATVLTSIYLAICFVVVAVLFTKEEPNPEYDKWLSDAHQAIEELPVESYEIVYIKIDPEMSSDIGGVFFLGSGSIHTKIERATPVTVAYKDGDEVFVETFWANTNMKLSEDDTPYLAFHNLPKSLGHGIEKGWYNPVVHLPRNYEFKEIK